MLVFPCRSRVAAAVHKSIRAFPCRPRVMPVLPERVCVFFLVVRVCRRCCPLCVCLSWSCTCPAAAVGLLRKVDGFATGDVRVCGECGECVV